MLRDNKIRCVLVHDHVLLRQGLRRLLEDEPDLEVIGEAADHMEALQSIVDLHPDVVIAEPSTLGLAAPDVQRWLTQQNPHAQVLFLASDRHKPMPMPVCGIHEAGRAVRETSVEELVAMVRKACQGTRGNGVFGDDRDSSRNRPLTAREKEVLKLLAGGRTVRSVAKILGLSNKTVDVHKFNLMRKLGIHNKAELILWAIKEHLVKVPANS